MVSDATQADVGRVAVKRLSPEEIAARQADDPLVRSRTGAADRQPAIPSERQRDTDHAASGEPDPNHAHTATSTPAPPTFKVVAPGNLSLDDRRAYLETFRPQMPDRDFRLVKAQVIDLILDTEVTNQNSLARMMTLGSRFGVWCMDNSGDGQFIPERDFTEDRLRDYDAYAYRDLDNGTAATYLSILRKLAGNKPRRAVKGRRVAAPPYPNSNKRLMWQTVADLETWMGVELRTLLALSFGVGARSEEIHQMRASHITVTGRHTIVAITRRHIVRDVPVYDDYATWLRHRAAELHADDYLFRPTVTKRTDAIGSLVRSAGQRSRVFEGFQARRARHTWVCELLQQPISYNALRTAADINVGSNLFADLTPHLPYVTPNQLRQAFDAAHTSRKDHS